MSEYWEFWDCDGVPITVGDTIEHTGHGERYRVCLPGTDGYLESHEGFILLPETAKHNLAFKLTERRAEKARVVQ